MGTRAFRSDVTTRPTRRRGLTLTDVCVALAVVVLLGAGFLPGLRRAAQERNDRVRCAANLREIAQGAFVYANVQRIYPRTYWAPMDPTPALYTGANVANPFADNGVAPAGPKPNDVTAAFYHLLRHEQLSRKIFLCPSDSATIAYDGKDIEQFSNFPGRANLSYSYSNPYPTRQAVGEGWSFKMETDKDMPLAADMNYGDTTAGGPTRVAHDAAAADLRTANSANHRFEGQNVVYVDGRVEWQTTPFCGRLAARPAGRKWRDNIYANADGVDEATGKGGRTHGAPTAVWDAVLLPTYFDGPQPDEVRVPVAGAKPLPASRPATRRPK